MVSSVPEAAGETCLTEVIAPVRAWLRVRVQVRKGRQRRAT